MRARKKKKEEKKLETGDPQESVVLSRSLSNDFFSEPSFLGESLFITSTLCLLFILPFLSFSRLCQAGSFVILETTQNKNRETRYISRQTPSPPLRDPLFPLTLSYLHTFVFHVFNNDHAPLADRDSVSLYSP